MLLSHIREILKREEEDEDKDEGEGEGEDEEKIRARGQETSDPARSTRLSFPTLTIISVENSEMQEKKGTERRGGEERGEENGKREWRRNEQGNHTAHGTLLYHQFCCFRPAKL